MLEALQKSWKRKKKKHVLYWFWCYGHNFIADKKRQTARREEDDDDDEKVDGKKKSIDKYWQDGALYTDRYAHTIILRINITHYVEIPGPTCLFAVFYFSRSLGIFFLLIFSLFSDPYTAKHIHTQQQRNRTTCTRDEA